jgi:carboxymethylenebutenolidase
MSVPGAVSESARAGLREAEVYFPGHGGDQIDAYLVAPEKCGPHGVLVIHEAYGLNEHIRDVVRRFAALGYTALAPDLYSREDLPEKLEMREALSLVLSQSDEAVVADLRGAVGFLAEQLGKEAKLGCVGFCSGGRQALMLACADERLDAAVDCWGGFVAKANREEETTAQRPAPPIDMVGGLAAPLMIVVGAEDKNPSPADAEALAERLRGAGKDFELDVYEDAGHAFFADYRPNYVESAAQRLWGEMTAFFAAHLDS